MQTSVSFMHTFFHFFFFLNFQVFKSLVWENCLDFPKIKLSIASSKMNNNSFEISIDLCQLTWERKKKQNCRVICRSSFFSFRQSVGWFFISLKFASFDYQCSVYICTIHTYIIAPMTMKSNKNGASAKSKRACILHRKATKKKNNNVDNDEEAWVACVLFA